MWDWISKLQELRGQAHALVTLISCRGSTPRETGAKMIVLPDGRFFGTIGGGQLEQQCLAEAVICLKRGESRRLHIELCPKTGQCCGGVVEVFVDVVKNPPKLYLFGAGHVGQALSRTMVGTAFEVHVIDERPEWIESTELPASVVRHQKSWRSFLSEVQMDPHQSYVAVMTHSHDLDQEIIAEVSSKNLRYVGLIGSDAKWRRFRQRLEARGVSPEDLKRIRCPIGLPVGGKAPQDVAISVASELLQIHHRDPS